MHSQRSSSLTQPSVGGGPAKAPTKTLSSASRAAAVQEDMDLDVDSPNWSPFHATFHRPTIDASAQQAELALLRKKRRRRIPPPSALPLAEVEDLALASQNYFNRHRGSGLPPLDGISDGVAIRNAAATTQRNMASSSSPHMQRSKNETMSGHQFQGGRNSTTRLRSASSLPSSSRPTPRVSSSSSSSSFYQGPLFIGCITLINGHGHRLPSYPPPQVSAGGVLSSIPHDLLILKPHSSGGPVEEAILKTLPPGWSLWRIREWALLGPKYSVSGANVKPPLAPSQIDGHHHGHDEEDDSTEGLSSRERWLRQQLITMHHRHHGDVPDHGMAEVLVGLHGELDRQRANSQLRAFGTARPFDWCAVEKTSHPGVYRPISLGREDRLTGVTTNTHPSVPHVGEETSSKNQLMHLS